MDDLVRHTLTYRNGCLALTSTHLLVVRGSYLSESLALPHLTVVGVEEAHSFRHRIFGLLLGSALLAFGLVICAGNLALLGRFHGRFGIGAIFAVFFGVAFLAPVVTSRRIWWLRVRYGSATKLIPLAGVEPDALEQFVGTLSEALDSCQ